MKHEHGVRTEPERVELAARNGAGSDKPPGYNAGPVEGRYERAVQLQSHSRQYLTCDIRNRLQREAKVTPSHWSVSGHALQFTSPPSSNALCTPTPTAEPLAFTRIMGAPTPSMRRPGAPMTMQQTHEQASLRSPFPHDPYLLHKPLPPPTAAAKVDIDLATTAANTPNIAFVPPSQHPSPIIALRCSNPTSTSIRLKQWLYSSVATELAQCPRLLRIDPQELEQLPPGKEGTLLLLRDAATISFGDQNVRTPLTILTLFMPHDSRLRWFYTPFDMSFGLSQLEDLELVKVRKLFTAGSKHHARLYTFLGEQFAKDIALPHHPDYLRANEITDYAPEIEFTGPQAMKKLEANEYLHEHPPRDGGRDISEDRYIFELHEAERWLASEMGLHCAEYLKIKRLFFRDYGVECIKFKEKLEPYVEVSEQRQALGNAPRRHGGARYRGGGRRDKVRTEAANCKWLENEMGWRNTKAKRLITGWKLLGLLEDIKFVDWAMAGGMLEEAGNEADDEDESGEEVANVTSCGGLGT